MDKPQIFYKRSINLVYLVYVISRKENNFRAVNGKIHEENWTFPFP